eukprot:Tamp_10870.p1 GENE.Tamp_10870~~Tamp_10870.p1  ORF type:complete len:660 (+),score=96.02 Tamp_10870:65-1981(+)
MGFHGTVEQVAEATDREYYAFLNLTPECTDEEIKVAYRRLALLWHPDRHTDADSRERATAQFARLTQIHDVLTDPKRRKLYDLYGEKGLSSGLEVGAHLRTHDQVREEYLRQMTKKNQKRLEAKLGVSGVLQTSLDLQHYLRDWIGPAEYVTYRQDSDGRGRRQKDSGEEKEVLQSAMLSERFRTSLSRKDTLELQGQVVSKKGKGAGLLSIIAKRTFSSRSWAKVTCQTGHGVDDLPVSVGGFRALSEDTMSKLTFRCAGQVLQLRCGLLHKVASDTLGKIQYILGGQEAGVKLRAQRSGERTHVSASVWVGVRQYTLAALWNRQVSKRTSITVSLNLGEGGLLIDLSSRRRISENSALGCQCLMSFVKGVTLRLSVGRMGQDLSIPMLLSSRLSIKSVLVGAVLPTITQVLLKVLWLGPRARRRKARKLTQLREENFESTQRARREAAQDVELMKFAVDRKRRQEQERRGLVIIKAVYGRLPPLPGTAAATASASHRRKSGGVGIQSEWPGDVTDDTPFVLVTSPLQYLAEDSKLQLFNSCKSGLPGFCDPCPGEEKALYVLYRFKGLLHEVCVADTNPLTIPVMRDKLAENATRLVDGALLVQPSASGAIVTPAGNTAGQTPGSQGSNTPWGVRP